MSKLAVAYAMKKKKMAKGGEVEDEAYAEKGVHNGDKGQSMAGMFNSHSKDSGQSGELSKKFAKQEHEKVLSEMKAMPNPKLKGLAMGGPAGVMEEDDKDLNQHMPMTKEDMYDDLVERIMEHKSADFSSEARLSEGGMVANDVGNGESADEMPNQFDDLVLDDDLESSYDGANSGDELGNKQEDEDRHDIVSKIMKSNRKKDRNPRPA